MASYQADLIAYKAAMKDYRKARQAEVGNAGNILQCIVSRAGACLQKSAKQVNDEDEAMDDSDDKASDPSEEQASSPNDEAEERDEGSSAMQEGDDDNIDDDNDDNDDNDENEEEEGDGNEDDDDEEEGNESDDAMDSKADKSTKPSQPVYAGGNCSLLASFD